MRKEPHFYTTFLRETILGQRYARNIRSRTDSKYIFLAESRAFISNISSWSSNTSANQQATLIQGFLGAHFRIDGILVTPLLRGARLPRLRRQATVRRPVSSASQPLKPYSKQWYKF